MTFVQTTAFNQSYLTWTAILSNNASNKQLSLSKVSYPSFSKINSCATLNRTTLIKSINLCSPVYGMLTGLGSASRLYPDTIREQSSTQIEH